MKTLHYFIVAVIFTIGAAAARSKGSRMLVQPIKLYYLPPSPPCRVVMMAARVVGVELDLVLTNILEGAHMTPEYLKLFYNHPGLMNVAREVGIDLNLFYMKIKKNKTPDMTSEDDNERIMNPQHTIPTMDDNGFILWESLEAKDYNLFDYNEDLLLDDRRIVKSRTLMQNVTSRAIIAYFVNAYGKGDALYPRNPRQRAIVDQRLNFDLGTLFQRYANLYVPMLFRGEAYNEENADKLNEALGWLNTMLDGKAFVAGDNLTIADISMLTTFTNLDAMGYDFSAHENLTKWFERMKKEMEPYGYMEIDHAGAQILASFLKKD